MRKAPIAELYLLRSVACFGVVVIHVLTFVLGYPGGTSKWIVQSFSALQMLLMFSTPAFVFLSAAVVGYSYDRAPVGFLRKRARYVLVPFISIGILYALFHAWLAFRQHGDAERLFSEFLYSSGRNLMGGGHPWFIVPIFQFYLLYVLLEERLRRASPTVVIAGALLINVAYLGFFHLVPMADSSYAQLLGKHWYSLLFPAWTLYFAVGFYAGRHYDALQEWLRAHLRVLGVAAAAGAVLLLWMHFSKTLPDVSSRRIDVLLYGICMICLILHLGTRLRRIPPLLVRVSQVSFGIYLLHPFVLEILWRLLFFRLPRPPMLVSVLMYSVGGIVGSLILTAFLARVPLGSLLVGRIRPLEKQQTLSAGTEALIQEPAPAVRA